MTLCDSTDITRDMGCLEAIVAVCDQVDAEIGACEVVPTMVSGIMIVFEEENAEWYILDDIPGQLEWFVHVDYHIFDVMLLGCVWACGVYDFEGIRGGQKCKDPDGKIHDWTEVRNQSR